MPDPDYRIPAEDRARVPSDFDIDALETLLQNMDPESRPYILRSFTELTAVQRGVDEIGPDGKSYTRLPDVNILTGISDPVLNELLGRVWAPRWKHLSLRELERRGSDMPGIEVAKRAARERGDAE